MTETLLIWLFGIIGAWCVLITVAIHRLMLQMERFKGLLVSISKKAADYLHSPDNHHGLDYYLEQYVKHHHDMSTPEWAELMAKCKELSDSPNAKKDEQFAAALLFLIELSLHKQSRGMPPITQK